MTYAQYLKSLHWLRLRRRKIEQCGSMCNRCRSSENIEVHHLYYGKSWWDCQLADLEVLCEICHRKEHGKPWKEEKHKKTVKPKNFQVFAQPFRRADRNVCARY